MWKVLIGKLQASGLSLGVVSPVLNSKNDLMDFSFSLRHIWRKWIHSQLLLSPLYLFDSQICISTSLFSTRSPTWPDGFVVEMF